MMFAVSANPVVRSSLEEMLESLQRKDKLLENPENCDPPSLPARPKPNSRARPPSSAKRCIPANSDIPQRPLGSDLSNGWEKGIFRFQAKEIETGESQEEANASPKEVVVVTDCDATGGGDSRHENGYCRPLSDERRVPPHAHCEFHDLKEVVTTLQSYVRGEIARREIRRNLRKPEDGSKSHCDQRPDAAVLLIQSVLRGWLVRRQQLLACLQSPAAPPFKDVPPPAPGVVEELQRRVLMAETALGERDKEITILKEQVGHLESKMKAMEDMWQKKIDFLQMRLDTAKVNPVDPGNGLRKHIYEAQSPPHSEETSMGSLTPGCGSPVRFMDILFRDSKTPASASNSVAPLVNEFEQHKQLFDLEAQAIVEAKHSPSAPKPLEQVQTLKHKFDAWKKDFGFRLREARERARRMGPHEGDKQRWKWWGLKRRRS